jgi:rRNA maturation endonuclease Nob1
MYLKKCDICKKQIKGYPIRAGAGFLSEKDFCLKCGKPVLDFLKKHKFKIIEKI